MATTHPMQGEHFHVSNIEDEFPDVENDNEDEEEAEERENVLLSHQEGPFARLKNLEVSKQWSEIIKIFLASGERDASLEKQCKPLLLQHNDKNRNASTFLHWLAKNGDQGTFNQLPLDTCKILAQYALQRSADRYSSSLSSSVQGRKTASREEPIFTIALQEQNYGFVKWVLTHCHEYAPALLQARSLSEDRNCIQDLLWGMAQISPKKGRAQLEKATPLLRQLIEMATPEILAHGDKKGVTALHVAMMYNVCRLPIADYPTAIIPTLIEKSDKVFTTAHGRQFTNSKLSPYQYFVESRLKFQKSRPGKDASDTGIKDKTTASLKVKSSNPREQDPTSARKEQLMSQTTAQRQEEKEIHLMVKKEKPTNAPRTPDGRIQHRNSLRPTALPETTHDGPPSNTAKSKPRHQGEASEGNEKILSMTPPAHKEDNGEKAALSVRDYLSLHYIRTRSDLMAKELLQGTVASDRNLYLHASHLRGQKVEALVTLIEKLSNPGGFHDTLSYVDLPLLSATIREKAQSSSNRANEGKHRQNTRQMSEIIPPVNNILVPVFRKLFTAGVRTILRLHVEDRFETAHSDAAIEEALRGYESTSVPPLNIESIHVEIWDWKKFDMSIDVIVFAAPNVVQINLYWKGNQSVLRGWASSDGIPRLHKDGQKTLKKVVIHAYPGLESLARMRKSFEKFEVDLLSRTANEVKVELKFYSEGFTLRGESDNEPANSNMEEPEVNPTHDWITHMEAFRGVLRKLHSSLPSNLKPLPRIKVALIDDGVDLERLDSYNNIVQASGVSYFPPLGRTERPYHESTNGHGTIMANMIVRVNPWVDLDVMRIQDSVTNGAKGVTRKIYAKTAARAIEGAVDRKARIISISWTIQSLAKNPTHYRATEGDKLAIEQLKRAIERALSNDIIIFCSAADQIDSLAEEWLPYGVDPGRIFLIGSATSHAKLDSASGSAKPLTYYFPGNKVAEAQNPRSGKPVEYHTGSSVATALAAGLASLIMYLAELVDNYYVVMKRKESIGYSKVQSWACNLKYGTNIRTAFNNIIQYKDIEDPKYLPVWHLFGEYTQKLEGPNQDIVMAELENLVGTLCKAIKAIS